MSEHNEKLKTQGIRPYSIGIGKNQIGSAVKVDGIANYRNVLNDAQRLLQEREYSLAIVRVITAFEVFILNKIIMMHPNEEKNIRNVLSSEKFKGKLLSYLKTSGKEDAKQTREWSDYYAIQQQRNAIVHLGSDFGHKEAVFALEQITSLITLLQD